MPLLRARMKRLVLRRSQVGAWRSAADMTRFSSSSPTAGPREHYVFFRMQRVLGVIINAVWAIGMASCETWATLTIRDLGKFGVSRFLRFLPAFDAAVESSTPPVLSAAMHHYFSSEISSDLIRC